MITIQTAKQLNIVLPATYKYMDQEYVDLFFNEGIIRVSSFQKFKKYPDEIRGDKSEGGGSFNTKSKEGTQFHLMTKVGESEYMFCSSLINSEEIKKDFKATSLFKIKNPLEFSAAISNSIVGCTQGFLGFCNYQEYRIIKKEIDGFSINEFTDENGNFMIGGPKMSRRTNEIIGNGVDLMFLKENKYQGQAEFRFIWSINGKFNSMSEHLDVNCKEAIQYCERVDEK